MSWRQFGGSPTDLPISTIVRDPVLQVRAGGTDKEHAADLAADVKKGEKLPRVWILNVEGHGNLLCGGWHTLDAYELLGRAKIPCLLKAGTYAEARFYAAGSNNSKNHKAKKMTTADKQRAVRTALEANKDLPAKEQWSNRKIAEHVGVSHTMVDEMAALLEQRAKIRSTGRVATAEAEPDPKPVDPKRGSIMSDDWQDMPLEEFLDVPDFTTAALNAAKLYTAGELLKELDAGVTLGLKEGPLKTLRDQIEHLRDTAEAAAAGRAGPVPPFDWRQAEGRLGVAVRGIEAVANHFPNEKASEEYAAIDRAFRSIFVEFAKWRARLKKGK